MKLPSLRFLPAGLLALPLFFLTGCESGPSERSVDEVRHSVQPMAANDAFFDGKVAVELTLGSALPGEKPEKGPGGKGKRGGGHRPNGGYHGQSNRSGLTGEVGSDTESYEGSTSTYVPPPTYTESPMPPAMLSLSLKNTSAEQIVVEIRELNSELGNFATRPDKFTLEPGASDAPTAMQSLLGVDSLALPVTVTLRVAGKNETKVLTLRPITPPPSPAAK